MVTTSMATLATAAYLAQVRLLLALWLAGPGATTGWAPIKFQHISCVA